MKAGRVVLVGRPNSGKSTLLNNILGHKVAITSPKPQTTRFSIEAVFSDDRGQIIFIDTPGLYAQAGSLLSQNINQLVTNTYHEGDFDVLVNVIDRTRPRAREENRTLGFIRTIDKPKILAVNKSDLKVQDYWAQYAFYEAEFDKVIFISAITHHNLNLLLNTIFEYLPDREPLIDTSKLVQPGLNLNSKTYLAEIIREKVFLLMREEVPYTVHTIIDSIENRDDGILYIKARIITTADRYKSMLIGKNGVMIKEIGIIARKELEAASNRKVYLHLEVEVDPHWQEAL